ncbi:ribose-phosphate diphosphokinase [Halorarum salinum]|uniref:ribose-phosphate diphosphokinase n=1 Tax=Halorarum salinum TaxID=2743089 RepID=A0A7D5QD51_9EURY|nr:ribose-phosphate diphosphokinase [Halobaculum salinum]QLG61861.1 ribose-phosphate diphosphokinase [Halobaculum salinum]
MDLVVTPSAEHLDVDAHRLAPHPRDGSRTFPDDEVYVQLAGLDSLDDVVLIHAGQPRPNRGLAYLHGTLELLVENDCSVTLAFSYVPYGRQDEAFYEGTLNYARSILRKLTGYYGVDRIYTVDPHFGHRDWVREVPLEVLHAFPAIRNHVSMDDYVVVGPDLGAVERFGVPGFEKVRGSAHDVELTGELDVDGRDVLVFDDLIATGGTMVEAFRRLKNQGAGTVQAAAVHGVVDEGVRRVRDTYDALYLTNTVANDAANVRIERTMLDGVLGEDAPSDTD